MSKNRSSRAPQDRARVSLDDRQSIKYWTQKWAVTESQLRQAVRKVGDNPDVVALELGRPV